MDSETLVADLPAHDQRLLDLLTIGDLRDALSGPVRDVILQAHRDNFTSSASPRGDGWPPRKIAGDGHPLLMETGALLQAATGGGAGHVTEVDGRSLSVGVDLSVEEGGIPGARAHEFGYPQRNLPARPWLGAKEEDLDRIDEILADAVLALIEEAL